MNANERYTVLFIALYTEMGGGEVAIYHLLKELDKTRCEPVLLVNTEGSLTEAVRGLGVRTEIMPFRTVMLKELIRPSVFVRMMNDATMMTKFLETNRVDIIHCGDVLSLALIAPAVMRKKIPVVYSVIFFYEWTRLILFNMLALGTVSTIVTNSFLIEEDLRRRMVLMGQTVRTVYPGIEGDAFRPKRTGERNVLREELHIPESVKLIGTIGRIDPMKGQLVFLRAAEQLLRTRNDLKFLIVGNVQNENIMPFLMEYEKQLKNFVASRGLQEQVLFLGHRNDIPDVLRSLDVAVCPSVSEGFGLSVAEAYAVGIPVVTGNAVGIIELLRNEQGMFIAETGDSNSFASGIEQALAYGTEPVHRPSKPGGWDVQARTLEECYQQLIHQS